jgi:transcriptional regulator with XRE-family HTH domain
MNTKAPNTHLIQESTKMIIKGRQITAARGLLGLSQDELAKACGVAKNTINRFEAGEVSPWPRTTRKITAELERRGIEFSNGTGIGVRLDYEKAKTADPLLRKTYPRSPLDPRS